MNQVKKVPMALAEMMICMVCVIYYSLKKLHICMEMQKREKVSSYQPTESVVRVTMKRKSERRRGTRGRGRGRRRERRRGRRKIRKRGGGKSPLQRKSMKKTIEEGKGRAINEGKL